LFFRNNGGAGTDQRCVQATAQTQVQPADASAAQSLALHWPEYFMEAANLGVFMISACIFGVLLEHPGSPFNQLIEDGFVRRVLAGVAMGLTAIGIFTSPWGRRSGAHMNPAVTLTFLSLGKVRKWDALFYVLSQFLGGALGVGVARLLVGMALGDTGVNYVATAPGPQGPAVAFAAELLISFLMMTTVLFVSNDGRTARYTPFVAGALVAIFIAFESPLSGMSMNPARTLGSAVHSLDFTSLWIYFTAPFAGMFAAGQLYRSRFGAHHVFCAKLHHHNNLSRCIFRCNYGEIESHE
jgi:aquaporin Z